MNSDLFDCLIRKIDWFKYCIICLDEIAKLFPNLFGQPSAMLVPHATSGAASDQSLKIGVVLSGGQAPGGHNVICGLFGETFYFGCNCNTSCLWLSSISHNNFSFGKIKN